MRLAHPPAPEFWTRVVKREPLDCWLWTGPKDPDGYGRARMKGVKNAPHTGAHRIAYHLHYGVDPAKMEVRHTCDNPPCCNPAHLILGTHLDNMRDRTLRKRTAAGSRNGRAKLSDEAVRTLRKRHAESKGTIRTIAAELGINFHVAKDILKGKTWRHLLPVEGGAS